MRFGTTDWIPSLLLILFHRPFFLLLLLTLKDVSHLIFNFANDLFWRCFNSVFVLCNCEHKHSFGPTGFGSAEFWALSLKYFWSHEKRIDPGYCRRRIGLRDVPSTTEHSLKVPSRQKTTKPIMFSNILRIFHSPQDEEFCCVFGPARILWR